MVARKQKLRIIQTSLLLLGIMIIFFTYLSKDENKEQVIIPKSTQEKIKRQLDQEDKQGVDIFYNIEYSGLDLSGNRYILKSKEAFSDKTNSGFNDRYLNIIEKYPEDWKQICSNEEINEYSKKIFDIEIEW